MAGIILDESADLSKDDLIVYLEELLVASWKFSRSKSKDLFFRIVTYLMNEELWLSRKIGRWYDIEPKDTVFSDMLYLATIWKEIARISKPDIVNTVDTTKATQMMQDMANHTAKVMYKDYPNMSTTLRKKLVK